VPADSFQPSMVIDDAKKQWLSIETGVPRSVIDEAF
jgi:hypothetical protein